MERNFLSRAAEYINEERRKRRWTKVVTAMAAVVVFCTTYALILPAITLETDVFCGQKEHSHDEGCYEQSLICTQEEAKAHAHGADCYETHRTLVCTLEESAGHTHSVACMTESSTLTCASEEEGHEHGDGCYTVTSSVTCGQAEEAGHTHGDSCWQETKTLVCTESTEIPEGGHVHGADCYGGEELACEKEEHEHELMCYSNPRADLESSSVWERTLPDELTYIWADDLLAVAESQLGYRESTENYQVDDEGRKLGYTRYGDWYGDNYGHWCAMFVSFCLHYAEIPTQDFPWEANCQRWIDELSEEKWDLYRPYDPESDENYVPVPGDLIFFNTDDDPESDHVGIVKEVEPATESREAQVVTIEGNSTNRVEENTYDLTDDAIMGYAQLPEAEYLCGLEIHDHSSDCYDAESTLTCEVPEHAHEKGCITGDFALEEPEEPEEEPSQEDPAPEETPSEEEPEEEPVYICEKEGHLHDVDCHDSEGILICEKQEHVHTEDCVAEAPAPVEPVPDIGEPYTKEFVVEDEEMILELTVTGVLHLPEKAVEEEVSEEETEQTNPWDKVELKVIDLDQGSETFDRILDYARENGGNDELYDIRAMEFHFFYEGAELDISDWEIVAEVSLTEQMMTPPEVNPFEENVLEALAVVEEIDIEQQPMALMSMRAMPGDESDDEMDLREITKTAAEPTEPIPADTGIIAPEAEVGVVVSLFQEAEEEVSQLDSVLLQEGDVTPVLRTAVKGNTFAVAASSTANPQFTVQYYAKMDRITLRDSGTLPVIDTDNGGENKGGILPENGKDVPARYLNLNNDGSVTKENILTEVYQSYEYSYIEAPNLTYFNRLYENGNYRLAEVWILNEGSDPTSIAETDWTVITDPANTHFTNRAESAAVDGGPVLIEDDAVIRLVFDTVGANYSNAGAFYDYDITDTKFYQSASTTGGTYATQPAQTTKVYARTDKQGINSNLASLSGAKLAFGNANTGMGYASETWNDNTLNKYNEQNRDDVLQGCTFGLVSELNALGNIVYSSGVAAPNLFSEGAAVGKTAFNGQLNFTQAGDTYSLSSVAVTNGGSVGGLERFNHPSYGTTKIHEKIWTNNFWPMDGVGRAGHDLRFGYYDDSYGEIYKDKYRYHFSEDGSIATSTFPLSDDGIDHNHYFGMEYTVRFDLTKDYVGPLEYLFFGDDDMWVFLDGRLVCDIGGVHSSVGEYVNLWDYIDRTGRTSDSSHELKFFYTERGASGSSCFMQFTLPSVSSVTPEQNTGSLKVEKYIDGPSDGTESFHFDIYFKDANGHNLKDDYAYIKYDAKGNILGRDLIIFDGGSFDLKNGEYVIIPYLPEGTRYTITETTQEGYSTSVSLDGTIEAGATATGTIEKLHVDHVKYINKTSYVLPNTGGGGTDLYTFGGLLLMLGAGFLLYRKTRDGREAKISS